MSTINNSLKNVSTKQIEEAVAKALSELTGTQYDCNISNIEYSVVAGGKFEVTLSLQDMFTRKPHKLG